jgi:HAD superfamily hydrolase (TIGR01509 family)
MGSSELLERLIGRPDPDIARSWREHFDRLLPEVRALPGAAQLLRALHDRGLVVVLATSSPQDLLDELRARVGAHDAVDVVTTASDVDHAKPAPEIFQIALKRADLRPEDALVLGDSVWDVEAAARAGLRTVGVETGGFSRFELEHAGAIAVFSDAADLVSRLDDSPFSRLLSAAGG